MQLSKSQQREIFQNGYTLLREAIPQKLVNAALFAINNSLGLHGMHPDDLPTLRAQSYCPELTSTPAITDLFFASPLHSLCESAFGEGNVLPITGGQIALRFPGAWPKSIVIKPHLDGLATRDNGVTPGVIANFTALVGVFLSDVSETDMGNLAVWPGTHHAYEKYLQTHGAASLLDGTPPIDLPSPEPIRARAGDAVICHYQLGHSVIPNLSPHVRYAIFFRISHRELNDHRVEVLTDIWRDWPGIETRIEDE